VSAVVSVSACDPVAGPAIHSARACPLQGPSEAFASVLTHPLEEPLPVVADCSLSTANAAGQLSTSSPAAYAGWSQERVVWSSRELPFVATHNEVCQLRCTILQHTKHLLYKSITALETTCPAIHGQQQTYILQHVLLLTPALHCFLLLLLAGPGPFVHLAHAPAAARRKHNRQRM
jgi:hypothetical protein